MKKAAFMCKIGNCIITETNIDLTRYHGPAQPNGRGLRFVSGSSSCATTKIHAWTLTTTYKPQSIYRLWYELQKRDPRVGRNASPIFLPFVDQSSSDMRRRDCSLQRRFTFDDILFRSRNISDHSASDSFASRDLGAI